MTETATLHDFLMEHVYEYERYRELYPESMPTEAHRYTSPDDFIRDAKRYGHFFDERTMRSFNTKTYELIGERFLIMSDRMDSGTPRQYRVGYIYQHKATCNNPSHVNKSVERLETKFITLAAARRAALLLAKLIP